MKGTDKAFAKAHPVTLILILVMVQSLGGGSGYFDGDDFCSTDLEERRICVTREWEAAVLAEPWHGDNLSGPFSEYLLVSIKMLITFKRWI